MKSKPDSPQPILFVGIDWADREHAVACRPEKGPQLQHETFEQDPEAIAEWVASLETRFPAHRILIALEQSRGALMAGLAAFDQLELYPVNPKQLARYREAIYPSGGKNDPGDAGLLAEFLRHHRDRLRPWQPDTTETREIAERTELRRKLVEERKRLVLQLKSSLKQSFPLILKLCKRELHHAFFLDLLKRWPSLEQLQRVHPKTLRKFLKEHGMTNENQQTEFIETVRAAQPLTKDKALIEPRSQYVEVLVQQIRELNRAIAGFDEQLRELVTRHPDQDLFGSLPGAGEALVPRLIAAFGSDRDRYQSAAQVQCYSGIAPITKQSGNSKHVDKRLACPKFLRQTFHEFADHARKWSPWSKAFYRMKRAAGMKHHAAVRALAYKWIRILFRMWKTRTKYDEAKYLARLKTSNSPVMGYLEP